MVCHSYYKNLPQRLLLAICHILSLSEKELVIVGFINPVHASRK